MSDVQVGPVVSRDQIPSWLHAVTDNPDVISERVLARGGDRARLASLAAKAGGQRAAAVLVLMSGSFDPDPNSPGGLPGDAEILLTERAATLRTHSGQVAFPGGARDPGDDYPIGTAMREAEEETGLSGDGVTILANLPVFPVPSGFQVHPVLAHWTKPSEVFAVDHGETARVMRANLRELLSPENRFQVSRSIVGATVYKGPAFMYDGMLVWGFTGGLIAAISEAAGWDVPWNTDDVRPLEQMIAETGGRQISGFDDPPGGSDAHDVNGDR
ncbi:NUDIX hydrolase [Gordonia sp. (in: high G+C Gram-positive bacteria)]|uniref:NUDIX hydrolase n=1 Tax=Gordonia sp. (in: high G+C Gram-positive bacteria) TaxID=84139 RepID=UPI003C757FD8